MAINVNELRIGNLVLAGNMNEVRWGTYQQKVRQVTLITLDIDDEYMEYITHVEPGIGHVEPRKHNNEVDDLCGNIEPIPLTGEWLLKFGFEDRLPWTLETFRLDNEHRLSIVSGTGYSVIVAREVKTVHRLQNVFFSLTGEELKIK